MFCFREEQVISAACQAVHENRGRFKVALTICHCQGDLHFGQDIVISNHPVLTPFDYYFEFSG